MTSNEILILNYLTLIDAYIDQNTLLSLGVTQADIDATASHPNVQIKKIVNNEISHGLFCNNFDASNYVYILDNDGVKPIDNLNIFIKIQCKDYTLSTNRTFIHKNNSYRLYLNNTNKLVIQIYDGTSFIDYECSNTNPFIDNHTVWLKIVWSYDDGAGDSSVDFYYSEEEVAAASDVQSWTLIENITNTQHSIEYSNDPIYIGGLDTSGEEIIGTIYAFEIFDNSQSRLLYNFAYDANINNTEDIIIDIYGNVLIRVGNDNYFIQNTIGEINYKYELNLGDKSVGV